jgi:hypothetical protein
MKGGHSGTLDRSAPEKIENVVGVLFFLSQDVLHQPPRGDVAVMCARSTSAAGSKSGSPPSWLIRSAARIVVTLLGGVLAELRRHLRAIDARPQHPASHLRGGVGLTLGEVVQPLRPVDERVVWGRTRR